MSDWDDVARIALSLPESEQRLARENRQWRVKEKLFVWERPLRAKEAEELGERAPQGPVLGARVEHLGAKQALLEDDPNVYFTTSHFEAMRRSSFGSIGSRRLSSRKWSWRLGWCERRSGWSRLTLPSAGVRR